jgi:hypothetical protein
VIGSRLSFCAGSVSFQFPLWGLGDSCIGLPGEFVVELYFHPQQFTKAASLNLSRNSEEAAGLVFV